MKYRKKPVVVEAEQWVENGDQLVSSYRNPYDTGHRHCNHCNHVMLDHGWIDTLQGGHTVCPGDWIITGVKGERYPCKPDIFEAPYEEVEEDGPWWKWERLSQGQRLAILLPRLYGDREAKT